MGFIKLLVILCLICRLFGDHPPCKLIDRELGTYEARKFRWPGHYLWLKHFLSPLYPDMISVENIRGGGSTTRGEDDKVYVFTHDTKMIRLCEDNLDNDHLKWTTDTNKLEAVLHCPRPTGSGVYEVLDDAFILWAEDWRDILIYGVFKAKGGGDKESAVCAYKMADVDKVFSKWASKKKAEVEPPQGWVWYDDIIPPRPGACMNNLMTIVNGAYQPSEQLKFGQFKSKRVEEKLLPIGNTSLLGSEDDIYRAITVERIRALDGNVYYIFYVGTDNGVVHKSVIYEDGVHILEKIQMTENPDEGWQLRIFGPKLWSKSAGHSADTPKASCSRYLYCNSCILARDPHCAWNLYSAACVNIFDVPRQQLWMLIQNLKGDPNKCFSVSRPLPINYQLVTVKPGSSAELLCLGNSNLTQVMWKFNGLALTMDSHYQLIGDSLLINSVAPEDQGGYHCWTVEWDPAAQKNFTRFLSGSVLALTLSPTAPPQTDHVTTNTPTATHI